MSYFVIPNSSSVDKPKGLISVSIVELSVNQG